MEKINWKYIYRNRVSDRLLPEPLPYWTMDQDEDSRLTLEWLARYYRTGAYPNAEDGIDKPSGHYMTRQENILEKIKDQWYAQLWTNRRMFYHLCDPKALLDFRRKYESVKMVTHKVTSVKDFKFDWQSQLKTSWSSCWSVVGRDGWTESMLHQYDFNHYLMDVALVEKYTGIKKFLSSGVGYRFRCDKCAEPMPSTLKTWILMQELKKC